MAGASGTGRDVVTFTPTTLGDATSGTFAVFRTGSELRLPSTAGLSGFFVR